MQILNTSTSLPSSPFNKLALYSGLDVLTLFEIKDGLLPLTSAGFVIENETDLKAFVYALLNGDDDEE